jgi:hypothetical protein
MIVIQTLASLKRDTPRLEASFHFRLNFRLTISITDTFEVVTAMLMEIRIF